MDTESETSLAERSALFSKVVNTTLERNTGMAIPLHSLVRPTKRSTIKVLLEEHVKIDILCFGR